MKPQHLVTRSNVNENQYNPQDLPKSGFDMSYNSNADFILGRLHVGGYHHTMPGDKFSGSNEGDFTFNRIVTPLIGDVNVCQHNFYLPIRALDTTFEDAFAPSKHNGMSASWTVPQFDLATVVEQFFTILNATNQINVILNSSGIGTSTGQITYNDLQNSISIIASSISALSSVDAVKNLYLTDIVPDLLEWFNTLCNSITTTTSRQEYVQILLDALLTPLFGENSLLDTLGYNYLRRFDILHISGLPKVETSSVAAIISKLDNIPMCEYAIRMYYAVWYERYRDVNLEPVSPNLPKWKQFGSSSVIESNPFFLCLRIRPWAKDIFTSAQIDDISRHVYAPVIENSLHGSGNEGETYSSSDSYNYVNAESNSLRSISIYSIDYKDLNGAETNIKCPLPSSINDCLSTVNLENSVSSYYLDLVQYRKSLNLERYLKRNLYFGDEYKDRMRAQYGSDVSDERVNIPQLLSSSVQSLDRSQQIASMSTDAMSAGERTMTATANSSNDGYTFFSEEFGIVLNIISFLPEAQYAGVCPQNMLSKVIDFPLPVFANNNEEFSRNMEIASSGLRKIDKAKRTFGHHPYAHAWRSRVNEVHGSFLSDKQDYTFRRFFGLDSDNSIPQLNYQFIHCKPNLGAFADTVRLAGQLYGKIQHNFYVERTLPTPVEDI